MYALLRRPWPHFSAALVVYFSVHGRAVGVASLEALTSMGGRAMPSALRDGTCDLAANKTYQLFQYVWACSERVSHATAGAGRATRQGQLT